MEEYKLKLYQLDGAELDLLSKIDDLYSESRDNDTDPDIEAQRLINEHLEALATIQEQIGPKLRGYIKAINSKRAQSEMLKAEADIYLAEGERLTRRAAEETKSADFLVSQLKAFMERRDLTRLEVGTNTVTITSQGGEQPVLFTPGVTPTQVPEKFRRHVPATDEFNKISIRAALKSGEELTIERPSPEGGEPLIIPWARLGPRQTKLKIS